jgi:acyl-CoA synthetase (AMP-forming)/AMP-acid ligase II
MPEQIAPTTAGTLVDVLQQQADRYHDTLAFSFCPDGDDEESRISYRGLDIRARAIAATLQAQGATGERVLVMCRPGIESIAGFFGCFYAGAVAVPVNEQWTSPRISTVVPDAQAGFALATARTPAKIKALVDDLAGGRALRWSAMDEAGGAAENWVMPEIDAGTTAMIQYTSGSTGSPKGVVVTHRNFLHNLESIRQAWNPESDNPVYTSAVSGVSWLPHYHDMGLVGGIFGTLYGGGSTVLMSPSAFLMRPMRWLQAMSRYRAVIGAGPNFAYDLCVKRSTPEQRAALDLSNWSIAVVGGEPVRAATLHAFAEAFAPAGFRPEALQPMYGLAEGTVGVSGASSPVLPTIRHIDRTALGAGRVVEAAPDEVMTTAVVGCGPVGGGQRVIIVDPETQRECHRTEVGEIWVSGPSVAQGYWRKPEETEQTFAAHLSDTGEGPFLRTGDMGFFRSGELFVTGRCQDLMIVNGCNYYPNDIEMTVQDCHSVLLPGRGAVFSTTAGRGGPEQLVVVQEVHRHRDDGVELTEVVDAIRAAIVEHHGIEAHDVLLVKPMKIPTTSSGKIQRGECRQQFLDGDLEVVAEWHAPPPPVDEAANAKKAAGALRLAGFVAKRLIEQRQQTRED